jgi:hypothetical protein
MRVNAHTRLRTCTRAHSGEVNHCSCGSGLFMRTYTLCVLINTNNLQDASSRHAHTTQKG